MLVPEFFTFREMGNSTSIDRDQEIAKDTDVGIYISYSLDDVVYHSGAAKTTAAYGNGCTIFDQNTDVLINAREKFGGYDVIPLELTLSNFIEQQGKMYMLKDWTGTEGYYPGLRSHQINSKDVDAPDINRFFRIYDTNYVFITADSQSDGSIFWNSVKESKYKVYSNDRQEGWLAYSK